MNSNNNNNFFFFLLTTVFFLLVLSCSSESEKRFNSLTKVNYAQIVKEQLALNSTNDSTFLDFVLGSDSASVENHINKLIEEKRIISKGTHRLKVMDAVIDLDGYFYKLQVSDSESLTCLLTTNYFENKLSVLTLFVLEDYAPVYMYEFMLKSYGTPNFIVKKGEHPLTEYKYFWAKGNVQTLLSDRIFNIIEFSDLRVESKKKLNNTPTSP